MLKIYKFRSLGDADSFDRAKTILETGKFWCAPLWDLNDPMEGVYTYLKGQENSPGFDGVFSSKNTTRICSFSGAAALKKPTMWGYYGNGFRGVAIEVSVSKNQVWKMTYQNQAAKWSATKNYTPANEVVRRLLTTKLTPWKGECEYRHLSTAPSQLQNIGEITGVYFGDPYCDTENVSEVVENSKSQRDYLCYKRHLIEIAHKRGYRCRLAGLAETQGKWTVLFREIGR